MASFTTRVELHGVNHDSEKYELLHKAMKIEGFSQVIKGSDGITYHLPTAEYDKSGNFTLQQVLESAKRAADKTGKKYAVLVTESNGSTWHGLDKVS